MAVSEAPYIAGPAQFDLDRCIHCGLCLNACPTYRELGLEMDSPRGRVYQMARVTSGETGVTPAYVEHIGLCLACRACESACPSGVPYGRMVDQARATIEASVKRPAAVRLLRKLVYKHLVVSPAALKAAAGLLFFYQRSGLRRLVRASGILRYFGKLGKAERLAPEAEFPSFFKHYGKVYSPEGPVRHRVALMGGCIANVTFARLNEATLRVLLNNGCEVSIPAHQTCCGSLHSHAGMEEEARKLARHNIDALLEGGFEAIITNAAGCGCAMKEYRELLASEPAYAERAQRFSALVRDVNEFLSSLELEPPGPLPCVVTYQDSCHLAHGQKIRAAPRKLLSAIPQLKLVEMPLSDQCCGSAGVYNVVQQEMAAAILTGKMANAQLTGAQIIATANPGCMLQLRAGVERHSTGQRVAHVVELLDEAYARRRRPGAESS